MESGWTPKQINDADVQKGNTAVLKQSSIVLRLPAIICVFLPKKIPVCVGPKALSASEPSLMSACCVFAVPVVFVLFFFLEPSFAAAPPVALWHWGSAMDLDSQSGWSQGSAWSGEVPPMMVRK